MSASKEHGETLAFLSAELQAGRRTSRDLVEACLARLETAPEGARRAFVSVAGPSARAAADAIDAARERKDPLPPYAGIPISIKDLFDVAGEITTAGSRVLAHDTPAEADAPIVDRLKRAGFVIIGRTNMTEFAYSGLGLNPHFGTPSLEGNDDDSLIPGGSSSGAAVSVRLGMAHGAIGTDTGGSCRIPAAFCDLTGFKPTASRVPREGCIPLSSTLDSIGPIARSVDCCTVLDAVMAGDRPEPLQGRPLKGARLLVPETLVLDDLDAPVASAFDMVLSTLSNAGAKISVAKVSEFAEAQDLNANGGFAAIESFAWHRKLLETRADLYDPRIIELIRRGEDVSAADYIDLVNARQSLVRRATRELSAFDAIVMPTVPRRPPRIGDLSDPRDYTHFNRLFLRNSFIINMIDGCALALPIGEAEHPQCSLTVAGISGADRTVLEISRTIEILLAERIAPAAARQNIG
jgi:aspartyl-tRNA(Asn)/glutamyl-tRNA(Gln) amidotransferase subunit A